MGKGRARRAFLVAQLLGTLVLVAITLLLGTSRSSGWEDERLQSVLIGAIVGLLVNALFDMLILGEEGNPFLEKIRLVLKTIVGGGALLYMLSLPATLPILGSGSSSFAGGSMAELMQLMTLVAALSIIVVTHMIGELLD